MTKTPKSDESSPVAIDQMTDDELVQYMVDCTTQASPKVERAKIFELFASRMQNGRQSFLLRCGLRKPKHGFEEIEQKLFNGHLTRGQYEAAMKLLSEQLPELESLRQVHLFYESQVETYSEFLRGVISGYQADLSNDLRGLLKSERRVTSTVMRFSRESSCYDVQLKQAFEYYQELNATQNRKIITLIGFTSDTAHFLVVQVVHQATEAWKLLHGLSPSEIRQLNSRNGRSACSVFFEQYMNSFPKPQQLLVLLGEEFVRAKVRLDTTIKESRASIGSNHFMDEGDIEQIVPVNSGLYGSVYRGFQTTLNRFGAIKVIKAEWQHRTTILDHARALSAAGPHPHLVTVYEVREMKLPGHELPQQVMIMEWLEGSRLGDRLGDTTFSTEQGRQFICNLISGIRQLHKANIAHLDLNYGNLFLTDDGGLKVFDADPNKDIWLSEQSSYTRQKTLNDDLASVRQIAYEIALRSGLRPSRISILDDELSKTQTLDEIEIAIRKTFDVT